MLTSIMENGITLSVSITLFPDGSTQIALPPETRDLLAALVANSPPTPPGFAPPPDYTLSLKPGKDRDYKWPNLIEAYTRVLEGTLHVRGKDYAVVVGHPKHKRTSSGRKRDRVTVWINRYPTIEVVEGDNGQAASVIRSKHDRGNANALSDVPDDYRAFGFTLDKFNSVVKGPRASNAYAVIDDLDHTDAWVLHAYLRYVGRRQRP
jgi:hypothetical protein